MERALAELSEELQLDERLKVDHDTMDELGMAATVDTIFHKIAASAAFMGDVTSAAKSEGRRELPNLGVDRARRGLYEDGAREDHPRGESGFRPQEAGVVAVRRAAPACGHLLQCREGP